MLRIITTTIMSDITLHKLLFRCCSSGSDSEKGEVVKMAELIKFGDSEIIIATRTEEIDPFLPIDEQIGMKIISGQKVVTIKNFSLDDLENLPIKLEKTIQKFKNHIAIEARKATKEE